MNEKAGKLARLRGRLRKIVTLFAIGFVSFGVLFLLANSRGIGYEATAEITSSRLVIEQHPCYGYICGGNLDYSLNPLLYPVSHLSGGRTTEQFVYISEPFDYSGNSVKDYAQARMLTREFFKNIPYYLAISSMVALGLSKTIDRVKTRLRKSETQLLPT